MCARARACVCAVCIECVCVWGGCTDVCACVRTCVCAFKPPLMQATRYQLKKKSKKKQRLKKRINIALLMARTPVLKRSKLNPHSKLCSKSFLPTDNHVRFGPTYFRYASAQWRGVEEEGVGVGGWGVGWGGGLCLAVATVQQAVGAIRAIIQTPFKF